MSSQALPLRCNNRLLGMLSDEQYAAIVPSLEPVHLNVKEVICERGQQASYVYFPCGCVLSLLALMESGLAVETGTIGKEGFTGIDVLLGVTHWSDTTLCQIEGDSMRMRSGDFREATQGDTPLRRLAERFVAVYLGLVSQSVACNRLHNIEERFARWVLMTHDRVNGDEFFLTQEFIADMLGVHRPSVSVVAGAFQQAGFIRYTRGRMSILNRQGLEDASCECYAIGAHQIEGLLAAA